MNKNLIKKTLVCGIVILFIGGIIIPSISGNVSKINDIKNVKTREINNAIQNKENNPQTMSATDWWPMFRHDSGNTGSSTSIAPDTNQLCWKKTISDEIYSATPIIYNDRLYISTGGFYNDILELPEITEKSNFETPDITEIINDFTIYKDEYYGGIYCLDADSGTKQWDYSLYAPNDPFIVDNKVYVTDFDYYSYGSSLYCLNAETGDNIWDQPVGGLVTSPTIATDDKIFLSCLNFYTYASSLKCYNLDGNNIWTYPLPMNEIIWLSAPAYCDGKVYFITIDIYSYYEGKLYCLNADTGQYIWSQPISAFYFFFPLTSPACKDGKVFVVDFDFYYYSSTLKCFNADTGSQLWNYSLGYSLAFGTPAISQDSAFIASTDLYSYNSWLYRISTNGDLIWKTPIPGIAYFSSSSSPVCSANKVFVLPWDYFYGYSSEICCKEIENGYTLWSYELDYETLACLSIADERVYTADSLGYIYAIGSLGDPPTPPIIDGPPEGSAGKELCWEFHSDDADGDMVKYYIVWGDGNSNETDFNSPCSPVEVCHIYEERGEYNITAYAEDEKGLISNTSKLKVNIPRVRVVYHPLLLQLFERFPMLEKLLTLLRMI